MENIYSKFYTGRKDPFGIGTWDSNNSKIRRKLNHSNSQPYFLSQNSSDSKNLILPAISSKYDNGARKPKKYETQTSSFSSSSYNYNTNKNRKELSNYIKDINKSVASKLQSDNFMAQQKLNNLKNNYNEIKTLLNNKIEKLEHDQQMQFDNLKYALEQGGGLKMMGAVKNANGGNKYDLQRAEEEDIIDVTRRIPKLLDEQLSKTYNIKKKYGTNRLMSKMPDIRRRVDDELSRQKALDDLKFKRELDEIEAKRANIRQERNRMLRELQNSDIDDLDDPLYLSPNPQLAPPLYNPYNPYMMPPPFPPYFMPPMNNNNNNHNDSTGDLIKIFLIKKLFDDKPQTIEKQTYPPFFYPFYPGMPYPFGNNKGQPIINYPQPLIVQPPYVPYQYPYMHGKNKDNESESQKGIPFIDPLEKYLEMVNKAKETSNNGDGGDDQGGENDNGGDDGDGGDEEEAGDGDGDGDGEEAGDGGEDGGDDGGDNGDDDAGGEDGDGGDEQGE